MNFTLNVPSFLERASLELALNLCQEDSFKAAVLSLERPTYGYFDLKDGFPYFVTNPKKLLLEKEKPGASNDRLVFFGVTDPVSTREQDSKPSFVTDARILLMWEMSDEFSRPCDSDENWVGNWFAAIDEQSEKLTNNLPTPLKFSVSSWIDRIALEYLSYCRRLEALFGVSRYFLTNFITRDDWTETCRLDEIKLAERLLNDSQLTAVQRYCVACVFCLLDDIPRLWDRLSNSEKIHISGRSEFRNSEHNIFVEEWSNRLIENRNVKAMQSKQVLWHYVCFELVAYGNLSLLKSFWKELNQQVRRDTVMDMALMSVEENLLMANEFFKTPHNSFKCHNLPSYYGELILFFLLEMDEHQRFSFFQESFESRGFNVLKCFLDRPLRKYFVQVVNQLWKIIPPDKYVDCLQTLASLYSEDINITLTLEFSGNYNLYYNFINGETTERYVWRKLYDNYCSSFCKKENQHFDYRTLLWRFWEETPQTYKQHVFHSQKLIYFDNYSKNVEGAFFTQLVKKSPFLKTDESLFKVIFNDLPETDRKILIHSSLGKHICSILLEKDKSSFVDWLLQRCLEEDKIRGYKKQLIFSDSGLKLCFFKLQANSENSLRDLLNWSFDLYSEKSLFKRVLFNEKFCLTECEILLSRGEFSEVERMMNFCLSSHELKKQFKTRCAKPVCINLFKYLKFEKLDKVLAWCFIEEEEKLNFKNEIFTQVASTTYYRLVILERWNDVKWFNEWFELSNQEIRQLKYNTVCDNLHSIECGLFHGVDVMHFYIAPYCWFLDDEIMLMTFKKVVEAKYFKEEFTSKIKIVKGNPFVKKLFFKNNISNREKIAKQRLYFLVNEVLAGTRKDVQNDSNKDSSVVKNKVK